jgi:hypothetical protein
MTVRPEDTTFSVPRFLSFIDLAYLFEAAKLADEVFASKLATCQMPDDQGHVGNINATRQSLLRAVFIASYAIIEQNLDEIVVMRRASTRTLLAPNDLKDRGISRSLTYANKALGHKIDLSQQSWKDLMLLQEVRNHLTHYGPDFDDSKEHDNRHVRFASSEYVTLRPVICFTINQIEKIFGLYTDCIRDFSESVRAPDGEKQ